MEVKAFVNHGRWIAKCPNCNGAELAKQGEPFICFSEYPGILSRDLNISNAEMGRARQAGAVMSVVFPTNKEEIDRLLSSRREENRNWDIDQSLDDLIAENNKHGVA